jgi:hypothetical protein
MPSSWMDRAPLRSGSRSQWQAQRIAANWCLEILVVESREGSNTGDRRQKQTLSPTNPDC